MGGPWCSAFGHPPLMGPCLRSSLHGPRRRAGAAVPGGLLASCASCVLGQGPVRNTTSALHPMHLSSMYHHIYTCIHISTHTNTQARMLITITIITHILASGIAHPPTLHAPLGHPTLERSDIRARSGSAFSGSSRRAVGHSRRSCRLVDRSCCSHPVGHSPDDRCSSRPAGRHSRRR